jgi:hypothetical protein
MPTPEHREAEDVQAIVYEEFCRWFHPVDTGPRDKYAAVSAKIWMLWLEYGAERQ